jgi:tRNA (guanine10-N2)-dimethyltransferase
MGSKIDLTEPDHILALIADGPSGALACGWMEGDGQAAFSNGERRAGERPFFKPVSLDPMLARLAVNLAAGPLDERPVIDPMTGTGGFLIEASLSGRTAMGIDIHSEMVQGATANLEWAHGGNAPTNAVVKRGDATRLEDILPVDWNGKVAGFVLDPPYGRNSHGSLDADPLLEGALNSARGVAHADAGFVLILPIHPLETHTTRALPLDHPFSLLNGAWPDVLGLLERCGWVPQSVHVERVHRSLSRLILHAQRAPQG